MSIIKDTFFGGAEKKAAKIQAGALKESQEITSEAAEQAKKDVGSHFLTASKIKREGFEDALAELRGSSGKQQTAFKGGISGAQQQLLAGLPQFQAAILGQEVDFGQLDPKVRQARAFAAAQAQRQEEQLAQEAARNANRSQFMEQASFRHDPRNPFSRIADLNVKNTGNRLAGFFGKL